MDEKKISRINELYKKAKTEALTDKEKAEQAELRSEFLEHIRKQTIDQIKRIKIVDDHGKVIKDLSKVDVSNKTISNK